MIFRVTFKDPDTLHDAIYDAVKADVATMAGLDEDEKEAVAEKRRERVAERVGRWFKYSEYVTIEIDTDADTAVVVPRD